MSNRYTTLPETIHPQSIIDLLKDTVSTINTLSDTYNKVKGFIFDTEAVYDRNPTAVDTLRNNILRLEEGYVSAVSPKYRKGTGNPIEGLEAFYKRGNLDDYIEIIKDFFPNNNSISKAMLTERQMLAYLYGVDIYGILFYSDRLINAYLAAVNDILDQGKNWKATDVLNKTNNSLHIINTLSGNVLPYDKKIKRTMKQWSNVIVTPSNFNHLEESHKNNFVITSAMLLGSAALIMGWPVASRAYQTYKIHRGKVLQGRIKSLQLLKLSLQDGDSGNKAVQKELELVSNRLEKDQRKLNKLLKEK